MALADTYGPTKEGMKLYSPSGPELNEPEYADGCFEVAWDDWNDSLEGRIVVVQCVQPLHATWTSLTS